MANAADRLCKKESTNSASKFLTPCRQVGLSRRSISNTGSGKLKNTPTLAIPVSHMNTSAKENDTPKRKYALGDQPNYGKKLNYSSDSDTAIEEGFCGFETPTKNESSKYRSMKENILLKKIYLLKKYDLSPTDLNNSALSVNLPDKIDNQIEEVTARINKKQKIIEELKITGLNTSQHNLNELLETTEKWRKSCQEVLKELQTHYNNCGQGYTILTLLSGFGIPCKLIRYSEDDLDFY